MLKSEVFSRDISNIDGSFCASTSNCWCATVSIRSVSGDPIESYPSALGGSLSCIEFGMSDRSSPNHSNTGGVLIHGGSSYVNRHPAVACQVPDTSGSAFRMQTGQSPASPAVSRHPTAACRIPDTSGSAFRMRTGWSPASPAASRHPAAAYVVPEFVGLATQTWAVSVGPTQGPESACLSRIARVRLCSDGSRDNWYYLRNPVRPRVRPMRLAKLHLSFSTGTTSVSQLGQPRFPPYYPPRRTAPGSSSVFCSSNLLSSTTTFVGSPPLPRNENPRSRAPNCSGDGGLTTTQISLL